MTPQDFVYKQAMDKAHKAGIIGRDASQIASQAVRLWRRDNKASEAIEKAIKQIPKYKPRKKI